uniref:Uncharacterized protein n=1 Tax=Avena sativa TaxID=4498 RepID=A0ACD5TZM4_AVESA
MKKGSVVYMIALLFMACLLDGRQCRPETTRTYKDGRANATTVELSSDQSKITLKICVPRDCKTKGEAWNRACICCLSDPDVPCFDTLKVCQANCPNLKSK